MPPGVLITRRGEAGKYDRGGPDTRKVSKKRTEERSEAEEGEIRGERRRRDLKEQKSWEGFRERWSLRSSLGAGAVQIRQMRQSGKT